MESIQNSLSETQQKLLEAEPGAELPGSRPLNSYL